MKTPKQIYLAYKNGDVAHRSKVQSFFAMFFGLATAVFKFVFGIVIKSFVWAYSGIYALGGSVAKFLFFMSTREKYGERQKANFCIAVAAILLVSAFIFDMCTMIKQFDEQSVTHYPLPVIIIASVYFFAAYVFTVIGLIRNRKNRRLNVFAYKVTGISGALINMVLLQRMIMSCLNLPVETFKKINSGFGYIIGATLALTAVILLVRCLLARKQFPKNNGTEAHPG